MCFMCAADFTMLHKVPRPVFKSTTNHDILSQRTELSNKFFFVANSVLLFVPVSNSRCHDGHVLPT